MPYTDAQGRPELIAAPFITKGTARGRVVAHAADGQVSQSDSPETSTEASAQLDDD